MGLIRTSFPGASEFHFEDALTKDLQPDSNRDRGILNSPVESDRSEVSPRQKCHQEVDPWQLTYIADFPGYIGGFRRSKESAPGPIRTGDLRIRSDRTAKRKARDY
jgi:hypothetical protein